MTDQTLVLLAALSLLVGLSAYAVLAGADFGGGVWDLFARGPRRADQRAAIEHGEQDVDPAEDDEPRQDARGRGEAVLVHLAYDTMITLGSLLLLPGLVALYAWRRRPHWLQHRLFLWGLVAAAPAAFICVETGWITTESGRQPWVVYEVLRRACACTG